MPELQPMEIRTFVVDVDSSGKSGAPVAAAVSASSLLFAAAAALLLGN